MFTGFTDETVRFFLDLRFHNYAEYFHQEHDRYERDVQQPFYDLINAVAPGLSRIDPEMELRPHRAISRIHRDTRFSRDKSPYRDHHWVLFRKAGEPREGSVFYWFEFGPDRLSWGLGVWGENRPLMDAFRRRLAAKPEETMKLIENCDLPGHHLMLDGRQFKRIDIPPGLPLGLIPWYRSREVAVMRDNIRYSWAFREDLPKRLLKDYQTIAPIYWLLRGAYDDRA